jgi:hypothetical protein
MKTTEKGELFTELTSEEAANVNGGYNWSPYYGYALASINPWTAYSYYQQANQMLFPVFNSALNSVPYAYGSPYQNLANTFYSAYNAILG